MSQDTERKDVKVTREAKIEAIIDATNNEVFLFDDWVYFYEHVIGQKPEKELRQQYSNLIEEIKSLYNTTARGMSSLVL